MRKTVLLSLACLTLSLAAASEARALHARALDQIAQTCEKKFFNLRIDLREPSNQTESMQAPMLDRKGWHFSSASGPILLREGERVEVTGLFNYSEKGFFIELAGESEGAVKDALRKRRRLRFRVMIETPADNPEGQAAEGLGLLRRAIDIPAEP